MPQQKASSPKLSEPDNKQVSKKSLLGEAVVGATTQLNQESENSPVAEKEKLTDQLNKNNSGDNEDEDYQDDDYEEDNDYEDDADDFEDVEDDSQKEAHHPTSKIQKTTTEKTI